MQKLYSVITVFAGKTSGETLCSPGNHHPYYSRLSVTWPKIVWLHTLNLPQPLRPVPSLKLGLPHSQNCLCCTAEPKLAQKRNSTASQEQSPGGTIHTVLSTLNLLGVIAIWTGGLSGFLGERAKFLESDSPLEAGLSGWLGCRPNSSSAFSCVYLSNIK